MLSVSLQYYAIIIAYVSSFLSFVFTVKYNYSDLFVISCLPPERGSALQLPSQVLVHLAVRTPRSHLQEIRLWCSASWQLLPLHVAPTLYGRLENSDLPPCYGREQRPTPELHLRHLQLLHESGYVREDVGLGDSIRGDEVSSIFPETIAMSLFSQSQSSFILLKYPKTSPR